MIHLKVTERKKKSNPKLIQKKIMNISIEINNRNQKKYKLSMK
jgi:hypothetical protein